MNLDRQLLHHLAQVEKALKKARNNNYSDKQKQAYQNGLFSLLDAISIEIKEKATFSDNELWLYQSYIEFIFKSLEFLDSSILNLIPYEIVTCLNKALSEWMQNDAQKYIIVTSLSNDIDQFSFDPTLATNELQYQVIENEYGIKFESRLVQFNIPKSLSRDYLISSIYYHELGHFIDTKYLITDSIARTIVRDFIDSRYSEYEMGELEFFLPYLSEINPVSNETVQEVFLICSSHLAEYFCDLFASQYIGNSLQDYLLYITKRKGGGYTHPETVKRNQVVDEFMSGTNCIIVNSINDALNEILGKTLENRFETLDPTDIYNFLPISIKNDAQLHGIFHMGRAIWNGDWTPFAENMKMENELQPEKIYTIVNNLLEKSIGNYIIEEKWAQKRL